MIKKSLLGLLILLVGTWNAVVYYVDLNIEEKLDSSVYNSVDKIWIARGLYDSREEENSISSFEKAFFSGATGVEVDFYYDVASKTFIVAHGKPKQGKDGVLVYEHKDGKLLTLEELFLKTGENHYFYLDYKNLDRLNAEETHQAIIRLNKITEFNSLKDRVYLEGSNPVKLSLYTDAGFKTLLGIHPLPESNFFASIVINAYKMFYYFQNISALALAYGDIDDPIYGPDTEVLLKGIPVFLFHGPTEEKLLRKLVNKADVKVILAGRGKSVNLTHIKASE